MKRHDRIVDTYVFNFTGSVRGLSIGAPVDFRGIVGGRGSGDLYALRSGHQAVQHSGRNSAFIPSASRRATRAEKGAAALTRIVTWWGTGWSNMVCVRNEKPATS